MTATKSNLDRISEGSETLTSKTDRSDKEKVRSIADLTSGSYTISKDDEEKTEEIEEDIPSAASDEKSKEIKIDLKQEERQDLYDVSVQDEESYTQDFVSDIQTTTRQDRLNLSTRSVTVMSEDVDLKTAPHSARSAAEAITEQISENLPSMGGDESFSHKIDLKSPKLADFENEKSEQDNESDMENSRYSNVESSRPSSGKSERSSLSLTEHESSESEKSPKVTGNEEPDFGKPVQPQIKPAQIYTDKILDIDDLLGSPDEIPEDITPLPSEPSTPTETPRQDSETTSRASNFYEPMSEFNIGDHVSVTGVNGERVKGTLLFRGNVKFAPGIWAGVELDRPEGRHNGLEDGERYFTCKDKHGLIVPGHDVRPAMESIAEEINLGDSMSSVNTDDAELQDLIDKAARNVESFDLATNDEDHRNILADRITDDLLQSVLKQDLSTIGNIASKQADRRKGPPVAPKPTRKSLELEVDVEVVSPREEPQDIVSPVERVVDVPEQRNQGCVNETTDSTVTNLMNDAIEHMLEIRQKSRQAKVKAEVIEPEAELEEEEGEESLASPTEEIQEVIDKNDDDADLLVDYPFRPGSPIPGLQSQKVSSGVCTNLL